MGLVLQGSSTGSPLSALEPLTRIDDGKGCTDQPAPVDCREIGGHSTKAGKHPEQCGLRVPKYCTPGGEEHRGSTSDNELQETGGHLECGTLLAHALELSGLEGTIQYTKMERSTAAQTTTGKTSEKQMVNCWVSQLLEDSLPCTADRYTKQYT